MPKESFKTFTIDEEEYKFLIGGRLTIATPKLIKEAFDKLEDEMITTQNGNKISAAALMKRFMREANSLYYRAYKCGAIP